MDNKRALRRFHRARMYKRAKKALWWYDEQRGWHTREEAHRQISRHRDNLAICSCASCGNPRRSGWGGPREILTIQERKELERYEYDMGEVVDLFTKKPYTGGMKVYCVPFYDKDCPKYSHTGFKALDGHNAQIAVASTVDELKEKVEETYPHAMINFIEMYDEGEFA